MLLPLVVIVRLTTTSGAGFGKTFPLLSKAISTVPAEEGFLLFAPLKIKLAAFSARRDLDDSLPRTKQMASPTLLFPDPLGPRMQLNLVSKGISVLCAKLLNP